jgi:hypothetical protein
MTRIMRWQQPHTSKYPGLLTVIGPLIIVDVLVTKPLTPSMKFDRSSFSLVELGEYVNEKVAGS